MIMRTKNDPIVKTVAFLQNAWSPMYAGETWPRRSWLAALHACRSGQRLKKLTDKMINIDIWYDNTTPIVGANPSSVVKPDKQHIEKIILEQKPELIILFGRQAKEAVLYMWSGPTLILPHPACRTLTNALYEQAANLFNLGLISNRKVELVNKKDGTIETFGL